jgi:hypothetical protein
LQTGKVQHRNSETAEQLEFGGMFADNVDVTVVVAEYLRTEVSQSSVSKHSDGASGNGNLFENPAGGGDGFNEDGERCCESIGDGVQVVFGNKHRVSESTVVMKDPDNSAIRAMRRPAAAADIADVAGAVDFADDALPGIATGTRDSDKLVSQYSPKPHVAAAELEISFADARFEHIHGNFVRSGVAEPGR